MKTKLRLSLLFGVALLAASCGGLKIPGTNSASYTDRNSPTSRGPLQPSGDPREDVRQAFLKLNAAKSWRSRVTTSAGKLIEIEFAAPDKFHTKGGSTEGQASLPEMIIVGKDTFFKLGSMPWRKAPTGLSIGEIVQQTRRPDVAEEMTKYQEIKFAGSETFAGVPMRVYEFKRQDEKGKLSAGKIWISASDGLPQRLESHGETESDSKPITTRMTVIYSDYNTDIKIEPPA